VAEEFSIKETKCTAVNLYHSRADNIGDKMCGPAQYFWPNSVTRASFVYELTVPENAILGGGQVFTQIDDYSKKFEKNPTGHLVAWGVGVPLKGNNDKLVLNVASRFALFGTRNFDWRDELNFVPCASCMSKVFDSAPSPTHEVVIFAHKKKTPFLNSVDGVPFMNNKNQNPQSVIDFIAKGETVVTSSYHGVYWAQLLGRKIVCIPYNRKFSTFQYIPVTASESSWKSMIKRAHRTEALLEEYRDINMRFAKQVAELMELDD
jgi:hypothetical protein